MHIMIIDIIINMKTNPGHTHPVAFVCACIFAILGQLVSQFVVMELDLLTSHLWDELEH